MEEDYYGTVGELLMLTIIVTAPHISPLALCSEERRVECDLPLRIFIPKELSNP